MTLVELLVVIAIFGLVLSILVPAIGRAKDQGNLIACRANLHNLAMACRAYAAEHDSFLPTDRNIDNPHTDLVTMLESNGYIQGMASYYCPSEKREDLRLNEENFNVGKIGYFYYSFTDRPTNRYLSNFLRKNIEWPRVLTDTMPADIWVTSDSWFSNMETSHRFYRKGVNYAVMDGSVNMVKESPRNQFR